MLRTRNLRVALLFGLVIMSQSLHADAESKIGWFEEETVQCDGWTTLANVSSTWFESKLDLRGQPNVGKIYLSTPFEVVRKASSTKGAILLDSVILDGAKAETLRKAVASVASTAEVPFLIETAVQVVSVFVGGGGISSFLNERLFSWLISEQEAVVVPLAALRTVVADGGELQRIIGFGKRKEKIFANVVTSYSVKVGNEKRTAILSSCRYATEIVVSSYLTEHKNNKKSFQLDGDVWRAFDLTNQSYESTGYRYIVQSNAYNYFEVIGEDELHRFSLIGGGPWQIQFNGSWNTLYSSVIAK